MPDNDPAQLAKTLGPLADNLVTAFSMDNSVKGSTVYWPKPFPQTPPPPLMARGMFTGNPLFLKDGDRQCVDFAAGKSSIRIAFPLDDSLRYTLTGWVKFPIASHQAYLWACLGAAPLVIEDGKFTCMHGPDSFDFGAPENLVDWHHVAVTCDGKQTAFFLDGKPHGTVPQIISGRVLAIGSKTFERPGENFHCGYVDDVFFFNRALAMDEIGKVMAVRIPAVTVTDVIRPNVTPQVPVAPDAAAANPANAPDPFAVVASADLVKTFRNSLVFVDGNNGAGSGFLATYNKATFLFTNAHVAAGVKGAGFKSLDGTRLQIGAGSAAVGHDIVLMQTNSNAKPFEIMQGVDQEAAIGDAIVVLGNSGGAGVVAPLIGRIVGIGPNLVEVDAPFVPGNSGSPIIHIKSNKVIGVATFATIKKLDPVTKKPLEKPLVRRFGYRLDSVKAWQPINWTTFAAQAAQMDSVEELTKALVKLIQDIDKNGKITPGAHTNPAVKSRIEAYQAQYRSRMSQKDIDNVNNNFAAYLKTLCRSDITAAQATLTYDYFRRKLEEEERERTEISGAFTIMLQSPSR